MSKWNRFSTISIWQEILENFPRILEHFYIFVDNFGLILHNSLKFIRLEYFANQSSWKLWYIKILNESMKLKTYESLIRPIVTYECEAWMMTNNDENVLRVSERKYSRKYTVHSKTSTKYDKSVEKLSWMGWLTRMDQQRGTRNVLEWKPTERRKGRSKKRWRDLQVIRVRNWRRVTIVKAYCWRN